jgi:DNA polymerase III alpha subunit
MRKGYSSYFLIQKKIVDEARRYSKEVLSIPPEYCIGKGRGSAAGSLVLYLLGITDVDPIKEDLLFSRFMSESRGGRSIVLEFDEE